MSPIDTIRAILATYGGALVSARFTYQAPCEDSEGETLADWEVDAAGLTRWHAADFEREATAALGCQVWCSMNSD